MSPETNSSKTKLCPVCGTRLNENAKKCLVCGTELDTVAETKKSPEIKAKRLPEINLSLPAALGLLLLFIALAAATIFLLLRKEPIGEIGDLSTPVAGTATASPTVTLTPTITTTPTQAPTWTPLPPLEYTIKPGDTCAIIAASFGVSIQSIILENNLSADCQLFENQAILVPQPTPTASPQPTATLSDAEKTDIACETINYTVQSGDTLSSIADTYNVSMATIRDYNTLLTDTVYEGQTLMIPLCLREPTPGPTPTPTQLPPYAGPNLLLPSDGASFISSSDTITLQWAAVGELSANEAYAVEIIDLTSEDKQSLTEYVRDTSLILPDTFMPKDGRPHVFRWSVYIVRQLGSGEENLENWQIAGNRSDERVFSWFTVSASTPQP